MKSTLASAAFAAFMTGAYAQVGSNSPPWDLANFTSLVVFGDSYSDDSRAGYFGSHDGQAPPVGWVDPVNNMSADGGRVWPEYVKQYSGANLYNYAVSGAVCSNELTPRVWSSINAPFPSVKDYEVPAYLADANYTYPENNTKFLDVDPSTTVYSMWIGTNDLGNYALLTDSQVAGTTIINYTDCVYNQLQNLYDSGARYFVLQNVAPLELTALYGLPPPLGGGVGNNRYWPDKTNGTTGNLTEVHYRMLETVVTVNSIYEYRTPFAVEINRRYPGAHFAVMDSYGLFYDIHNNPSEYLNGTAPLNVTGFVAHCNTTGGDCIANDSPDSFLWYDELHPSEQTERVVARTFVDVVKGTSKWASYWYAG